MMAWDDNPTVTLMTTRKIDSDDDSEDYVIRRAGKGRGAKWCTEARKYVCVRERGRERERERDGANREIERDRERGTRERRKSE